MTVIKTDAIVLRNRRFSESSVVATLFSRTYGRLDVLAKGARRDKSPMFGHLDLYQREDVLVYRRPQAGLDLLTEAAFVDEHAGLRFSPAAFAAAGLLAELCAETILPGDPQPELFDVLAASLALLSKTGEPAARAGLAKGSFFSAPEKDILIGRTLKLGLLDLLGWLGFGLELHRCTVCGERPPPEQTVSLSRHRGGLVCGNCRSQVRGTVGIRAPVLASLRERIPGSERYEMELVPEERRRWLRFLVDYAQHAIEKPLRAKKVLFQLM